MSRALEVFGDLGQLAQRGHAVEAPGADADRMDFAPAEDAHQLVAGLLQRQAGAHALAVILRHADAVRIAEEVRRVQHQHVQRMALDPFAAVDQPPQRAQLAADGHAERILDRVRGAHLVGDRADAADAGDDVRQLGVGPAAQERLEEARRLVDPQLRRGDAAVADRQVERAFALDTGEDVDRDGLSRHAP
ncbi:MAG TPA: hypothetical protein VJY39_01525, partial [Acidisphaera sp.]|nr:hypothetical protein [Acidisphaera sp.]